MVVVVVVVEAVVVVVVFLFFVSVVAAADAPDIEGALSSLQNAFNRTSRGVTPGDVVDGVCHSPKELFGGYGGGTDGGAKYGSIEGYVWRATHQETRQLQSRFHKAMRCAQLLWAKYDTDSTTRVYLRDLTVAVSDSACLCPRSVSYATWRSCLVHSER